MRVCFYGKKVVSRMRLVSLIVIVMSLAIASGCGKKLSGLVAINVEVVDEKTLLERQILGSYESLSQDLVLVASVRSVDREGRLVPLPDLPPGQREALNAMRVQEFYRDDIDRLKASGVLGENNRGRLAIRDELRDPQEKEFADSIVKSVNEARAVIIGRILETNEHLGDDDRERVESTFASIQHDSAKSGEWIQDTEGTWKKKA